MTSRLDQARRIAELREHRSERERREASSQAKECASLMPKADECWQRKSAERATAEQLLIADPSDPQAQLWRIISNEQEQSAQRDRSEAESELLSAQNTAKNARKSHERCCERTLLIEARIATENADKRRLAEEREAEEIVRIQS